MSHPIILLHGALGSKTQLMPLKKILEERGRKVNILNFSGHSGEPFSKDGFGIEVFVQDVIQFINDNKIESADIFGYSMGGYVALWLAHHYPLRVNNIITLGTKFDWTPETADREVRKMDAEKIQSKAPAFARILEHRHAPNDWKELMLKTSNMMLDLGDNPMLKPEIMVTIKHKTKVLLGDQDDMADHSYSEKVTGWLPNGEFRLLHDTPHPIEKVNLEMLNNSFD
jgi:esterase/lipase